MNDKKGVATWQVTLLYETKKRRDLIGDTRRSAKGIFWA